MADLKAGVDGDDSDSKTPRAGDSDDESAHGDTRKTPEEQRPLQSVIERVADDDAQEALNRLRTRQLIMERRLMTSEYLGRSQQSELSEMRVLVGPCMRIWPPKGASASWVRQQLNSAYWSGAFGSMANRIVAEFGIPYTLGLVSHSCEVEVANICRQKVPYCWPMMYNSTKVGLQEAQCHDARTYLKGSAELYAEQDQTDALKFLYGYPIDRRKLNADGKLSDDDEWSIEVVWPETNESTVFLNCLYDHENCTQRYLVDARVLWDMTWVESDIESCIRHIIPMYKPCVEFIVEPDDPKLTLRGKRRFKEQQSKGQSGKGAERNEEVQVDRTNNGLGKAGGIPDSMKGFLGGQRMKGGGKHTGKATIPGGKSFGRKGAAGSQFKGKQGNTQSFRVPTMPIGVDGGFAPQGYGGGGNFQHSQVQQFNPLEMMQQCFAQSMSKGKPFLS